MRAPVSVVIPTYNRVERLGRALASVEQQARPAQEVVVVDDGSEDGTAEMVAEKFPWTKLIRQPNRGVSAARNRGIREARQDWIAFLDSDDEWVPEKLARQHDALTRHPDLRFCHCDEIWVRNGRRVNQGVRHRKAGGWIFRDCLPLCAISPSAVLLHRSVLDSVGGFDESLPACEDYDLWLRITARFPVLFVEEPMVIKHGGHEDQLSATVPALDRFRIRALTRLLAEEQLSPGDHAAAVAALLAKIEVYRSGVAKRGRFTEVEELDRIADRYRPALEVARQGASQA